ncbi:hypothetical protein GGS21DRAFT_487662 [Xylaria nigripes]|nr:hypothetical protein GGS21DRAFT_487662 [Xylaria nigripes]
MSDNVTARYTAGDIADDNTANKDYNYNHQYRPTQSDNGKSIIQHRPTSRPQLLSIDPVNSRQIGADKQHNTMTLQQQWEAVFPKAHYMIERVGFIRAIGTINGEIAYPPLGTFARPAPATQTAADEVAQQAQRAVVPPYFHMVPQNQPGHFCSSGNLHNQLSFHGQFGHGNLAGTTYPHATSGQQGHGHLAGALFENSVFGQQGVGAPLQYAVPIHPWSSSMPSQFIAHATYGNMGQAGQNHVGNFADGMYNNRDPNHGAFTQPAYGGAYDRDRDPQPLGDQNGPIRQLLRRADHDEDEDAGERRIKRQRTDTDKADECVTVKAEHDDEDYEIIKASRSTPDKHLRLPNDIVTAIEENQKQGYCRMGKNTKITYVVMHTVDTDVVGLHLFTTLHAATAKALTVLVNHHPDLFIQIADSRGSERIKAVINRFKKWVPDEEDDEEESLFVSQSPPPRRAASPDSISSIEIDIPAYVYVGQYKISSWGLKLEDLDDDGSLVKIGVYPKGVHGS